MKIVSQYLVSYLSRCAEYFVKLVKLPNHHFFQTSKVQTISKKEIL